MQLGDFELISLSDGPLLIDGGTMFGVVPKPLWSKLIEPDEENRIELGLNCLFIRTGDHNVLIEAGVPRDIPAKWYDIYGISKSHNLLDSLDATGLAPEDIDVVVLTHLHFDHAGWCTRPVGSRHQPTFPNARYFVQSQEWLDANSPNELTEVGYIPSTFAPLAEAKQLTRLSGDADVCPGVRVVATGGHTRGHQMVLIESRGAKCVYPGDILPTSMHVPLPYVMAYDLYPLELLERKKQLLAKCRAEGHMIAWAHDPCTAFSRFVGGEDGEIELVDVL